MDVDRGQFLGRRLNDVPVIMDLPDFGDAAVWAASHGEPFRCFSPASMAAAAERFAPPSGANRSSAWSESPHPPPCLKRRERPVASMKNNVSGRETRFFVFLEKKRRDWHDTCMSFLSAA